MRRPDADARAGVRLVCGAGTQRPGSVDVVELDAASHGGVDDTRNCATGFLRTGAVALHRIFIVDEAHMVTTAGFNALPKIVEEPPEHLIRLRHNRTGEGAAHHPSRTHHHPFRLLAPRTMRALIERICAAEDVQIDDAVFRW